MRKLGSFTFQELNLTLEDIQAMSQGGPDLSYDFITRPAYQHALVTGDAEFLRLMLRLQRAYQIDPAALVHALQNHDELTLELVHFWTRHKDATFPFRGKPVKGSALRETIRTEMHDRLRPRRALHLKAARFSCTTVTVAAAALASTPSGVSRAAAERHPARHCPGPVHAMQPSSSPIRLLPCGRPPCPPSPCNPDRRGRHALVTGRLHLWASTPP